MEKSDEFVSLLETDREKIKYFKKYETEQEHSTQLESELSHKHQQEISNLEKKLENEKKKNAELEAEKRQTRG